MGDRITVTDPSTGASHGVIDVASPADVDAAVAAAVAALPGWSGQPVGARCALLRDAVKRAQGAVDELAALQAREMGQPVTLGRELVAASLGYLALVVAEAETYEWVRDLPAPGGARARVHRVPYGVGALITPWNFPILTAVEGLGRLLAAGSTVVWKPSERAPFACARLAGLLDLPEGVLTVVQGDGRAGAPLAEHPDVGIVVFTGSAPVGRAVGATAGRLLRPAVLELGGKDPVVVDAGVDPEWAASAVARGAFLNSGQICSSMERVYVHADVAAAFTEALVRAAGELRVGAASDADTEIGPLVDRRQRAIVEAHVADAVARGARVLAGGTTPDGPGSFYPPTVVVDVPDEALLLTEETFGPVAPVRVVASFEEGLALARDSAYGLCATVLTNDPEHAEQALSVPAALVFVNEWWGEVPGMAYEPARASGVGAVNGFDSVTRVFSSYAVGAGGGPPIATGGAARTADSSTSK